MSTIKSQDEDLTLNAHGSGNDIKFQSNGVEKASISGAGLFTSTTIDATKLTGTIPNFTSTGIDDNADATAITISSAENVGIGATSPSTSLHLKDNATAANTKLTVERSSLGYTGEYAASHCGTVTNNEFDIHTNNTVRMRISSAGKVGIATTASPAMLSLGQDSGSADSAACSGIAFKTSNNDDMFQISTEGGANNTARGLKFSADSTERMRMTASGYLLVGRSSANSTHRAQISHPGASSYGLQLNSTDSGSATHYHMTITRQDNQAGYMVSGPTSIGLANSSDERLKENIQDSTSATQDIKNIKVRQFDWKDNRDAHKDYGFVAQELVTVVPEAVAVGSDELNEDGTPVQIWGVDDSKLIPRLVKTIQELEARIAALEA